MKNIVIIGSGMGGLTAGAKLSKAGYNVTVIEKHFVAGGYATNFVRKAKTGEKVVFDVSLHGIGDLKEGRTFYSQLKDIGVFEKVKPLRKKETGTMLLKDGGFLDIPDTFEEYKKMLIDRFPKEQKGIENLFTFLKDFDEDMEVNVYQKGEIPKYIKELQNITLKDFLKKYVQDEEFIELFSFLWLYYGLPTEELNAYYYLVAWLGYHIGGTYYIEGGGGAFSKALADIIEENGGRIILREEVVKINTEGDKIISAETNTGKVFKGDIFILNGCLENLLDCVDDKKKIQPYFDNVKKLPSSCSLTQLYIGLDCSPTELGITKADLFCYFGENSETAYKYIEEKNYKNAHFGLVNYNLLDETLNKETGFLCVTLGDFEKNWPERDTEEYKQKKEEVTNILLERIYELFPKVKGHVVITELGTPKTMKRYTNNKEGAVYGFAQDIQNAGFNRLPQKAFFENTYIASSWTHPGGGYAGAMLAGIFCSDIIIDKYKEENKQTILLEPNMFIAGMIEDANKEYIKNQKINYLFNFTDINKKYYIKIENNKIKKEKHLDNIDVEIICTYKIWNDISDKKISGISAFREGSLTYIGDDEKFKLVPKIFSKQEEEEPKPRKLVNGTLLVPLALVPFIVYWSLSSFYNNATLFLLLGAIYPVAIMPIFKPSYAKKQITMLEIANIVCFSLYGALYLTPYKNLAIYSELVLPILLLVSCFMKETALAEYTKLGFEEEVCKTKLFKKINRNLTFMWAIIFIVQFIVVKVLFLAYPIANITYVLSLVGGVLSIVYPKKAMGN